MSTDKTIKIYIEGGCLLDVTGLPPDYNYELIDYDNQEDKKDEFGWSDYLNPKNEEE